MPPGKCAVLLLLAVLASSARCQHLNYDAATHLLLTIQQHFHSQCVFVLYKQARDQLDLYQLQGTTSMERTLSSHRVPLAVLSFQDFIDQRSSLHCDNRPLYFLASTDQENKDFLVELSGSQTWGLTGRVDESIDARRPAPRNPVWLMYLKVGKQFLSDVNIPFDCQLLIAQAYPNITELYELYKIAGHLPLRENSFGSIIFGKLRGPRKAFYDRRDTLKGLTLDVVTRQLIDVYTPFGHFPTTSSWCMKFLVSEPFTLIGEGEDGKKMTVGYVGSMWKALERQLNFSTNFDVRPANSPKSETIQAVADRKVHISLMDYTMTRERLQKVDFSAPILFTSYRIFIQHAGFELLKWTSYLEPFKTELWLTELLTLITLGLTLSLFYYMGRKFGSPEVEEDGTYTIYNSLFYMVGVFCMQGHDITPKSCACRMVYLVAYLTSIILMAAYSAALISFLAVQTSSMPFNDVQGMIADGSYQFGVPINSSGHQIIKESKDRIIRKLLTTNRKLQNDWPKGYLEGLQRVCDARFACMAPMDYAIMFNKEVSCTLWPIPEFALTVGMSFAIVKNSPYRGILNHNIDRMRMSGALQKLLNDARPKKLPDVVSELSEVRLADVAPILVALVMGALLAMLFLAGEKGIKKLLAKSDDTMLSFFQQNIKRANNQPRFIV